ncbi:MAG: hypothetical protein ACPG19_05220 [Saprospiraceae bacterium]
MEKIYDLITNYSFDELTKAQQSLVLTEISATEYEEIRQTIAASKQNLQGEFLAPSLLVGQNLSNHFNEKYAISNPFVKLFSIAIPLWFWLLSMAFLTAFFVLFYKKIAIIVPAEPVIEKVYVHEVDTIYIEKEANFSKENTNKTTTKPKKTIIKISTPKTTIQPQKPIAQAVTPNQMLTEIPISNYDSNLTKSLDNQHLGQQLSDDVPEIEVRVW